MKLIKNGSSLDSEIKNLSRKHENIAFAVAWASSGTGAFETILSNVDKINQAVIGTHFYQTHPDVLDRFIGCKQCRFIMQPSGVFHPKVFLFWSEYSWDLLIGSANLTKGALTKNTELMLHLTSEDSDDSLRLEIESTIQGYWSQGIAADFEMAQSYRGLWKTQQVALQRVSGSYSSAAKSISPMDSKIMTMSWDEYLNQVKEKSLHSLQERCDLLEEARDCFNKNKAFSDMALGERKSIAGLSNELNRNWAWFGSMKGAGYYHKAIKENSEYISSALDAIPLQGVVTQDSYNDYVDEFIRAFPNGRDGIAIASRLLALKRPDQFVCLNSKNRVQLCNDFGISRSNMKYERYWNEVICRVMDSTWWNAPKPLQKEDEKIWLARAAMLDAIFYQP